MGTTSEACGIPPQPFPDLSDDQRRLRTAAFWKLYAGVRPDVAVLAAACGMDPARAAAVLGELAAAGAVTLDAAARVSGSHGLSLLPAAYRVLFPSGERWVWCAEDAVGIPAALGLNATIDAACAGCGTDLALRIEGGVPYGPAGVRVWLSEREEGRRPLDGF